MSQHTLFGMNEIFEFYFALRPDEKSTARLAALAEQMRVQHSIRTRDPKTFHISLHYLGQYEGTPSDLLEKAQQAAGSIAVAPFEIVLDRASGFRGKNNSSFVLGMSQENPALTAFHGAMRKALILAGFGRWLQPAFTPHLTLFYDQMPFAEQPIPPIGWTVREFVLVRSQKLTGHTDLKTWPLR